MTYTWPTPGGSSGTWGTTLNANGADMDSRITVLEGAVVSSSSRTATAIVYGSTVPAAIRAPATSSSAYVWVCDGTADESEINAAITAVAALGAGTVMLVGEFFSISSPILMKTGIYLRGESIGCEVKAATTMTAMVMRLQRAGDRLPVLRPRRAGVGAYGIVVSSGATYSYIQGVTKANNTAGLSSSAPTGSTITVVSDAGGK